MEFLHAQVLDEGHHSLTYAPEESDVKSSGASSGDFASLSSGAPSGNNKLRFGETPNQAPEGASRVSCPCHSLGIIGGQTDGAIIRDWSSLTGDPRRPGPVTQAKGDSHCDCPLFARNRLISEAAGKDVGAVKVEEASVGHDRGERAAQVASVSSAAGLPRPVSPGPARASGERRRRAGARNPGREREAASRRHGKPARRRER